MNVDEALRRFAEEEDFPREALDWARDNWETAAPRLISKLRAFAAGGERTDAADAQIFYIVHLCGQMREPLAFEPLCRLIASDPEIEIPLGDAISETLPGILINVFDGDVAPLTGAIESPEGDERARGSALSALGYLVRSKSALDDDAMRAFLRRLRREVKPRDIPIFWFSWAETAAALGYEDLKMELAVLTKDGLLDAKDFGLDDFDEVASLARNDPDGLAGFHREGVRPNDDAIAKIESWSREDDEDLGFDDDALEDEHPQGNPFDGPYLNPFRDVGRNDPCPCGSGKKYKKCCLNADGA
jgi:hypothetical protein